MSTSGRRIVVTGASGNVGTGVLRRLRADLPDAHLVGVCRRPPPPVPPYDVEWHGVDLSGDRAAPTLEAAFRDADAVVHLAWAIQPVRDEPALRRVNVAGSRAVLRAVRTTGVGHLVYVSTLGVYAPRPAAPVDEGWPDSGQRTSAYSRHKVAVERMLDRFALDNPEITITRFRPTLVTQRDAAAAIKRLFLGPLVPRLALDALRRGLLPVLPMPAGLALQFVHADDVGDAVVRILEGRRGGIFNLAADVLHPDALAGLVGSRPLELPRAAVRAAVSVLHHLHLLAVSPGWFDMATNTPLMDSGRAHAELGWQPRRTSSESGRELVAGLADGAAGASPALAGR